MSDPRDAGDLPPDLPPEYAEAYRRGYERAFREANGQDVEREPEPEPRPETSVEYMPTTIRGPLFADEAWDDADDDLEPTQVVPVGAVPAPASPPPAHRAPEPATVHEPDLDSGPIWLGSADDDYDERDDLDAYTEEAPRERPGWFVPALLGALVLALVIGAYGIGRVLSSSVGDADVKAEEPDGVLIGDGAQGDGKGNDNGGGGGQGAGDKQQGGDQEAADAYQGTVEIAPIGGASASCQAPSSVDAAGNKVGYPPTSAYDGDLTTAWRCNGTGVGQTLSLTFAEPVEVGELALVPGYAKTDPRSGVDRYAENNRLTRVRWTFPDGTAVVQRLDGAPANRSMQALRIPPVQADSVQLEILASARGPRNTIAVSEVQIGRTAG